MLLYWTGYLRGKHTAASLLLPRAKVNLYPNGFHSPSIIASRIEKTLFIILPVCGHHIAHVMVLFSLLTCWPVHFLVHHLFLSTRKGFLNGMCVRIEGLQTSVWLPFLPASPTSSAAYISKLRCGWVNMKEIKPINLVWITSFGGILLKVVYWVAIYFSRLRFLLRIVLYE